MRGELLIDEYEKLFNERTKFVGVMHVSNALGTINPVKHMIALRARARRAGAGRRRAGRAASARSTCRTLDCDFYAFSGHKLCGPTGIGILYGKAALLETHAAVQGRRRHDPVRHVREDHVQHDSAQVRGGHAADSRGDRAGRRRRLPVNGRHGQRSPRTKSICSNYATEQVNAMPGVRIIGTAEKKAAVLSFAIDGRASARRRHAC